MSYPAVLDRARPARRAIVVPRLRRWGWIACLVSALALTGFEAAYLRSLSRKIAPVFEADLWALPTQIYSRPQTLYPGLTLEKSHLEARLRRLGYTEPSGETLRSGQFRTAAAGLEVFTRSFEHPDGSIQGDEIQIAFRDNGKLSSLSHRDGRKVEQVVLEPELLATLTGQNGEVRTVLPLSEFPQSLVQAVITAEDRRFFSHPGIDPFRIARAFWTNLRRGEIVQGASTITQQTVKNLFLDSKRTFSRKFREAQIALALESRYSKERILEVYLNEVYLGQHEGMAICGFGAAARLYFGKDVRDLDLAESALLAALIPAPAAMNPFKNVERAVTGRNTVLLAMLELGKISEASYRTALAQEPLLTRGSAAFRKAPFFVQFVRKQLRGQHTEQKIVREGMRVHTTLDTHLQSIAEEAVARGLANLEKTRPRLKRKNGAPLEAAMVVLDPSKGEILALVGGRDFSRNQFDHALLARRQPGSLFKPFIYLAGFERAERDPGLQFTPATLLDDSPIDLVSGNEHWTPQNYDEEFRGTLTVRRALEESLNVPAVRASGEIGLTEVAAVARRCGIPLPLTVYPSLALGSELATPMQMAQAYAVIAAGGQSVEPVGVRGVVSHAGTVLFKADATPRPVVSATSAYLTLDLLRGVLDRGTARRARGSGIVGDFAGKTGTTNENRDAWFIGFSSDLLAIVWVGFDDNAETGLTGADGALPIWIDFIRSIGKVPSVADRSEPPGIVRTWIDPRNGALATEHCPETLEEVFALGTEPLEPCPEHGSGDEPLDRFLTESRFASQQLRVWDDGYRLTEITRANEMGDEPWVTLQSLSAPGMR